MVLNLYVISQDVNLGYDTYDSAVVAASSSRAARKIHPRGIIFDPKADYETYDAWGSLSTWAQHPDQVKAELIGKAAAGVKPGVIISSFNAG